MAAIHARLVARARTEVGAFGIVVAFVVTTIVVLPALPPDGFAGLLAAVIAVAIGAVGAVLAEVAGRLSGTASLSWVSFGVWVLSVVVVPSTVQNIAGASATERSVLQLTALLLGVAALAVGMRGAARRPGVLVTAGAIVLLVLADVGARVLPGAAALARDPGCAAVVLGVSAVVACCAVGLGVRRRCPGFVRLGVGMATIVLAETFRAEGTVLFLAAFVVVAAGALHLARSAYGERIGLLEGELQEAAADRDELLAGTAKRDHELRNGLSGLSAMADVMPGGEERLRRVIEDELSRLVRIVDGAEHPDGSYDLGALVDRVADIARAGGMTITTDVPDGVLVVGRRAALHQVVTNLVLNCARHAPGSPVRISVGCDGERARVAVRDDGPGIPARDHERVFEPGVHRPDGGGSGLGLFISRELVAGDGGTVTVEPGGPGCTVVVELPARGPLGRSVAA